MQEAKPRKTGTAKRDDVNICGELSVQGNPLVFMARQQHERTELLPTSRLSTPVIVCDEDTAVSGTDSQMESCKVLAVGIPIVDWVVVPGGEHVYLWEMSEKGHPSILDFLDG